MKRRLSIQRLNQFIDSNPLKASLIFGSPFYPWVYIDAMFDENGIRIFTTNGEEQKGYYSLLENIRFLKFIDDNFYKIKPNIEKYQWKLLLKCPVCNDLEAKKLLRIV